MDEMSALISGLFDRLLARKREAPPPEAPEVPEDARTDERAAATERALLEWLDESGERCAQIAWVADRSMDGVGVRSPHPLPPGAPVLLTIGEDAPLKAMVRHCISDEDDWRIGLKVIRHEKRRFDRTPIEGEALVVWQSPAHGRRESPVQILDVGEGGLGLAGESRIPVQSVVSIIHDGWQRFGSVTHGHTEGERYVFGVQFAGPPRPHDSFDRWD
jgi:hypothetical protein